MFAIKLDRCWDACPCPCSRSPGKCWWSRIPRALARLLAPDFPLLAAPKENAGAVVWEETARHRRLPPN